MVLFRSNYYKIDVEKELLNFVSENFVLFLFPYAISNKQILKCFLQHFLSIFLFLLFIRLNFKMFFIRLDKRFITLDCESDTKLLPTLKEFLANKDFLFI